MKNIAIILFSICSLFFIDTTLWANDDEIVSKELAELVRKIEYMKSDDNILPSFMKNFTAEYIPQNVNIGRGKDDTDEKLLEFAKKYKPQNYNDYAKVFCPSIIKETKKAKSSYLPNIEEFAKKPNWPALKNLRRTIRLWTEHIRLLLENDGNDNAALVVTYAGYYLARELESSYAKSVNLTSKNLAIGLSSASSNELFCWAMKPRIKSIKLTKYLAKDLLDLVKNEYSFSNCLLFDEALIFSTFYESAKNSDENKIKFVDKLLNSEYLKEMVYIFFIEPKHFIDKPYYSCKDEIEKYSKKYKDKLDEMDKENEFVIKKTEEAQKSNIPLDGSNIDPIRMTINQIFSMGTTDFSHVKTSQEQKLAKMEMVAIALAYNSYYCENNKEPTNIEELENWFGEKFPVNRFTGKPYVFNIESGYVLYNYGIDGKKDEEDNYKNDDIYFKFSPKL